MGESVEKSCWGIAFWAVAIVLGVVVVGSFVSGVHSSKARAGYSDSVSSTTVVTR
ncbi:MAG: hypothetical protein V3V04_07210 [Rhizobiaceae bacterium]